MIPAYTTLDNNSNREEQCTLLRRYEAWEYDLEVLPER